MIEIDHQVVNLPSLWYPSSERWLSCYPSSVRWLLFVWLSAYPSKCRGDLFCALPLVKRLYLLERGVVSPGYCIAQNPQWRFPVWEVLCGQVSGNTSVWRRGRRAVCSNLETYLSVCVWSTFSTLSLSLILCLASFILLIHTYMLGCICLCASLMFNQESFI